MKRRILFLIFFIVVFGGGTRAQISVSNQDPLVCYSNFKNYYTQDVNYSMQCVRRLAADKEWGRKLLPELLHNSFMDYFSAYSNDLEGAKRDAKKFRVACTILDAMAADTCVLISDNAIPIQYWVNTFLNQRNEVYVDELVNDYIETQLAYRDIYKNKAGRYALLIYQIISKNEYMYGTARKLLAAVINESRSKAQGIPGSSPHPRHEERAYYRFLYAYGSYLDGKNKEEDLYINKACESYREAFYYSPDHSDMINREGFISDMEDFTIHNPDTFKIAYVNFLSNYTFESDTILRTMKLMAIQNPKKYKEPLRRYYSRTFSTSFPQYWLNNVNERAKDIPQDKEIVSFLEKNNGKWIFLDFWGMWCAPCLREQPDIERFYKGTIRNNREKIAMYTLNYNDNEEQVNHHITKNNYTFPVIKEDGAMVRIFNITNWPSKILITPQRKYIEIPPGTDWATFVKEYADL